jgi:hypothetical protein
MGYVGLAIETYSANGWTFNDSTYVELLQYLNYSHALPTSRPAPAATINPISGADLWQDVLVLSTGKPLYTLHPPFHVSATHVSSRDLLGIYILDQ